MNAIALKMLMGDRAKYLGLIFGIAFATLLMSQQVSIFIGLMSRTASQILDITEADVWVMHPKVSYIDEIEALPDIDLVRVRGVQGVSWAVPLYKGLAVIRSVDGIMNQVILMGIDDASLIGAPHKMIAGSLSSLHAPNAMIMDRAGYEFIWPHQPIEIGRAAEINDRRVVITGVAEARPPFVTFPVVFTRYSEALRFTPPQRNKMSFVLVKAANGVSPSELAQRISAQTGLQAHPWREFMWRSIEHYLTKTGIPVNFGITVLLGFIVGTAVAGQTFYLFIIENLKQFGALKAIGVTDGQILVMVLLQALVVGAIGFGIGIGLCATFFAATSNVTALRGFILWPEVMGGTALAVTLIIIMAAIASIAKVFVLEPAIVFRG